MSRQVPLRSGLLSKVKVRDPLPEGHSAASDDNPQPRIRYVLTTNPRDSERCQPVGKKRVSRDPYFWEAVRLRTMTLIGRISLNQLAEIFRLIVEVRQLDDQFLQAVCGALWLQIVRADGCHSSGDRGKIRARGWGPLVVIYNSLLAAGLRDEKVDKEFMNGVVEVVPFLSIQNCVMLLSCAARGGKKAEKFRDVVDAVTVRLSASLDQVDDEGLSMIMSSLAAIERQRTPLSDGVVRGVTSELIKRSEGGNLSLSDRSIPLMLNAFSRLRCDDPPVFLLLSQLILRPGFSCHSSKNILQIVYALLPFRFFSDPSLLVRLSKETERLAKQFFDRPTYLFFLYRVYSQFLLAEGVLYWGLDDPIGSKRVEEARAISQSVSRGFEQAAGLFADLFPPDLVQALQSYAAAQSVTEIGGVGRSRGSVREPLINQLISKARDIPPGAVGPAVAAVSQLLGVDDRLLHTSLGVFRERIVHEISDSSTASGARRADAGGGDLYPDEVSYLERFDVLHQIVVAYHAAGAADHEFLNVIGFYLMKNNGKMVRECPSFESIVELVHVFAKCKNDVRSILEFFFSVIAERTNEMTLFSSLSILQSIHLLQIKSEPFARTLIRAVVDPLSAEAVREVDEEDLRLLDSALRDVGVSHPPIADALRWNAGVRMHG